MTTKTQQEPDVGTGTAEDEPLVLEIDETGEQPRLTVSGVRTEEERRLVEDFLASVQINAWLGNYRRKT